MPRFVSLFLAFFFSFSAHAALPVPAPPELAASAWLLIDFNSGKVLAEHNPDQQVEPASLTKMMTAYVVFKEIAGGHLKLSDQVTISEKAWRTGGSKMFIEVGNQVRVEDLLKGLIIQSGNDAAVALAEFVAGDETTFAHLMNRHAERLGLTNTHFVNATGLPDPEHLTTAHDLAVIATALVHDFPEHYGWHAIKEYEWNGIRQFNRNKLLWRDSTVDGIKTGHTEAAGYCLVASAEREGMRLISVVLGTASDKARADANQTLLNYGFRFYNTRRVFSGGERLEDTKVWKGDSDNLPVGIANDLWATVSRRQFQDLKSEMSLNAKLIAPIAEGQEVGTLKLMLGEDVVAERPLIALRPIAEGGFFTRLRDSIKLWFE
ncbi:MAG: D-alanyl-D-alanine carboxypeptidase [Gammaproteobacteria bacterium]|nr:D-alanyl-D-alanine carboxypeptidase [Gammaproteobacteria bacterium]MCP5136636.1 D-alanyl-D-alanine carboxypeptidase [Gammaproteobacteria bacterium]